MTGLFIDLSEYLVDPIEDQVERAIRQLENNADYVYIPSPSNPKVYSVLTQGWVRDYPNRKIK